MPLVSIITPVYNEEDNIFNFYEALTDAIQDISNDYEFEFIFTDNNSQDKTREKILSLLEGDARIRYIKLSKNFGYQRSIWTGYSVCRGDVAIEIDVDLEDDPKHISKMIKHWRSGNLIVYGIRAKRVEPQWIQSTRKIYYRVLRNVSSDDIPVDAGDFMLLDRKIIQLIKKVRDPNLYIRGFVFSLGFKRFGFEYERNPRLRGKSNFNLLRMSSLAVDAFVRHSVLPLRLSTFVAAGLSFFLFLIAVVYVFFKQVLGADWPPGFATIVILQLSTMAINSLFIGVLGEYIWRIYRIIKNEPMSLIEFEIDRAFTEEKSEDIM